MKEQQWWWLAINGASCAASNFPIEVKKLAIQPVPQIVIGYRTQQEALERQQFFLTAPIEDVQRYFHSELRGMVAAGRAFVQRLPNPEPPTDGPTVWTNFPMDEV